MSQATDFDAAYVASKDPRIQALFAGYMGLPGTALDPGTRQSQALSLALGGLTIDPQIDVDGGDPYLIMSTRAGYGYSTVPALLQKLPPVFLPPGVHVPGVPDYDPSLWLIKVSTQISDYPKFVGPSESTSYIGAYCGNGLYNVINNAQNFFIAGQQYTENGVSYTFLVAVAANEYFWQRNS
jgi:hypothetical protein